MTFNEHWANLCLHTPQLAGDESVKMTITVGAFKAALKRSFDSGQGTDLAKREAARRFKDFGSNPSSPFGDLFG